MSWLVGRGISCMCRLKRDGESTDACGTSFVWRLVVDGLPSFVVVVNVADVTIIMA